MNLMMNPKMIMFLSVVFMFLGNYLMSCLVGCMLVLVNYK